MKRKYFALSFTNTRKGKMYTSDHPYGATKRLIATLVAVVLPSERRAEAQERTLSWLEEKFPKGLSGSRRFDITFWAGLSLAITFLAHMYAYPRVFAVGVTVMWALHEFGHMYAAWRLGLSVRAVHFIPFVGAIMRLTQRELMRDRRTEAIVGIAGPVSGLICTAVALLIWFFVEDGMEKRFAYDVYNVIILSVFYNILQMVITVRPFDGGRVAQIIHPIARPIGFAVIMVITFMFSLSWAFIMWILALTDSRFFFQHRRLWIVIAMILLMLGNMYVTGGRGNIWWNFSDLYIAWLALTWAWGEARKDQKPYYALPEWKFLVRLVKRLLGRWGKRGGDRRHGDRRQGPRPYTDRRHWERRYACATSVPIDLTFAKPSGEGAEFVDRRGQGRWRSWPQKEGWKWLGVYLGTLASLVLLLVVLYLHVPPH